MLRAWICGATSRGKPCSLQSSANANPVSDRSDLTALPGDVSQIRNARHLRLRRRVAVARHSLRVAALRASMSRLRLRERIERRFPQTSPRRPSVRHMRSEAHSCFAVGLSSRWVIAQPFAPSSWRTAETTMATSSYRTDQGNTASCSDLHSWQLTRLMMPSWRQLARIETVCAP